MKKKLKVIITESQFKRLIDNYDIKEVINESEPKKIILVNVNRQQKVDTIY